FCAHATPTTIVLPCPKTTLYPYTTFFLSMFITWMKTVGGRLESRLSFSSTITWNNFPLPHLNPQQRKAIIAAGQGILKARAKEPQRSLAEHYAPNTMTLNLVRAHDALDREVDRAFGANRRCSSDLERQELLFDRYQELTA